MPKSVSEIVTVGVDETLQGIGGDHSGGRNRVGVRVPTLALGSLPDATPQNSRYLFLLSTFSIAEGATARIIGFRKIVTLGLNTVQGPAPGPPRVVEQIQETPYWKFQDGNISWHLMDLGPPGGVGGGSQGVSQFGKRIPPEVVGPNITYSGPVAPGVAATLEGASYRVASAAALLYESITVPIVDPFYVDLSAYTPPFLGHIPGKPVVGGGFATMLDMRCDWGYKTQPYGRLNIPIMGPTTVALYASVRQSDPATRIALTPPDPFFDEGLSAEEQFLLNFPNAIYWTVGASLMVEIES